MNEKDFLKKISKVGGTLDESEALKKHMDDTRFGYRKKVMNNRELPGIPLELLEDYVNEAIAYYVEEKPRLIITTQLVSNKIMERHPGTLMNRKLLEAMVKKVKQERHLP